MSQELDLKIKTIIPPLPLTLYHPLPLPGPYTSLPLTLPPPVGPYIQARIRFVDTT